MEHYGTFWNLVEGHRTLWKVMEIMRINSIETHGM